MEFLKNIELPSIKQIHDAYNLIKKYAHETPLLTSQYINSISGSDIVFKCENFQKTGSFKIRGALNSVYSDIKEHQENGVTTHSSGNHAQALAKAGSLANINTHLVMPENAPSVKIEAVRAYGAKITFCKPNLQDRENTMEKLITKYGYKPIHGYNDIRVITGQATAAFELFHQIDYKPDFLITPVGGGGLISGTSIASSYFAPNTKVIGAEPAMANDAYLSFKKKEFVPSVAPNTIADGLKTSLGSLTFPIILKKVSDILLANENSIINAMKLIWERMKIIIEPSSAVVLAVILENPEMFRNKKTCAILSGGNVDLNKLPWLNLKV